MKESNILAVNANIEQLQRAVSLNTTGQYMKESDTLADNAANISLRKEIWINTKGPYMKESKTGNLAEHQRGVHERIQNVATHYRYIKANKH